MAGGVVPTVGGTTGAAGKDTGAAGVVAAGGEIGGAGVGSGGVIAGGVGTAVGSAGTGIGAAASSGAGTEAGAGALCTPSACGVGTLSTDPVRKVLGLALVNASGLPATRTAIICGRLIAVEGRTRLAIACRVSPGLTGP